MDYMKEEILKDYNIKRKEDKKRILDKYIEKVFIKEIKEEGKKKFEIELGVKLGKERGIVEYEVDRKKISLKNKRDNFYILNNELVDNSFEISNISFSPRNFELAIQSIQFIQSILYSIIFSTTS
jgi:hypothetical protein